MLGQYGLYMVQYRQTAPAMGFQRGGPFRDLAVQTGGMNIHNFPQPVMWTGVNGLVKGKIYRKPPYLMDKSMVSG